MRATRFSLAGRPLRYLIVGGWNTAFGLAFFSLLYLLFGKSIGYIGVLTIAQAVAVVQAHAAQRYVVWRSHGSYVHELMRFSAVYVGSYVVNLVLLTLGVDGLGLPVLATQWVVGLSLLVPAYLIQRRWAFRVDPAGSSSPLAAD